MTIDPDNTQHWDPHRYRRNAGFVAELGLPVVELLAPQSGEHILDLGCGEGALTQHLVSLGCTVVAVDASSDQIELARREGLDAHVMDGQALNFDGEFDAVFSNAALHWMPRAESVIDGVWNALKPGGRFVGEFGGGSNVARIARALDDERQARGYAPGSGNPWYFPSDADYAKLLEAQGFTSVECELIDRPTPLPGEITDWLRTFAESFTADIDPAEHTSFLEAVSRRLEPELRNPDGSWWADYMRLRFAAYKP